MTRVLLNDFAGHAFTLSLAESLPEVGFEVDYAYCSSNSTPHADFATSKVPVTPLSSGPTFEKYGLRQRVVAELRFGWNSARLIFRTRPDHVVMNNTPILSLLPAWIAARLRRAHYVVWLQDVQSGLVAGVKGQTSVAARLASFVEGFVLRRADQVVAISEPLAAAARNFGVDPESIAVLPNWTPVEHFEVGIRSNDWAVEHGLDRRPVLLYSGTLATKHRPELLLELADALPDVDVVVVSSGEGADRLAAEQVSSHRSNVHLFPFQPFERLNDVLATATVVVALLNSEASSHSVPSKVLSYLAAGRPVLASMPLDNPASRMIAFDADAGIVVAPEDVDAFFDTARQLIDDPERAAKLGDNGRVYAGRRFGRAAIADEFLRAARIGVPACPVG